MAGFTHDPGIVILPASSGSLAHKKESKRLELESPSIRTPLLKAPYSHARLRESSIPIVPVRFAYGAFYPADGPWYSFINLECCQGTPMYVRTETLSDGAKGLVFKMTAKHRSYVVKWAGEREIANINLLGYCEHVLALNRAQASALSDDERRTFGLTKEDLYTPQKAYNVLIKGLERLDVDKISALKDRHSETKFVAGDKQTRRALLNEFNRHATDPEQIKVASRIYSGLSLWPIKLVVMPYLGDSLTHHLRNSRKTFSLKGKDQFQCTCFTYAGPTNPMTGMKWSDHGLQQNYGFLMLVLELCRAYRNCKEVYLKAVANGKAVRNWTHGDLKPQNFVLDPSKKTATLIDWETIRHNNENRFHYSYFPCGTMHYLAPEMRESRSFLIKAKERPDRSCKSLLDRHYDLYHAQGRAVYQEPAAIITSGEVKKINSVELLKILNQPLAPVSREETPGITPPAPRRNKGFAILRRDERSDMYAFGCMVHDMFFEGKEARSKAKKSPVSNDYNLRYHYAIGLEESAFARAGKRKIDVQFTKIKGLTDSIPVFVDMGLPTVFWERFLPGMLAANPDKRFANWEIVESEIQLCVRSLLGCPERVATPSISLSSDTKEDESLAPSPARGSRSARTLSARSSTTFMSSDRAGSSYYAPQASTPPGRYDRVLRDYLGPL